jgi:dCTP deaminase
MVISCEIYGIGRYHVLKNDRWIREMAEKGMIRPYNKEQVRQGIISYGVSSYGYDMRIADEFKILKEETKIVVDPKNFDMNSFIDFRGDICTVPPNSFILGRSVEYFRIPRDVLVICLGKSTYARCGIVINVTPLEPEWEGHVTIEISNTAPLPAMIYANEGIAQILFIGGSEVCERSYADKAGKYQAQKGITPAKI